MWRKKKKKKTFIIAETTIICFFRTFAFIKARAINSANNMIELFTLKFL